jgi:hypothetical protein
VAAIALLGIVAAALFASLRAQTPGGSVAVSCATALRGASPVGSITGFTDIAFPAGASMTSVKSSLGGPSQFTLLDTDVCYSGSAAPNLAGAGWSAFPSFPYQGALLQPCGGQCYQMANSRYAALEQITDHGNSVFTYHLRLAAPPPAPTCDMNFANSPLQGVQTSVDGAPLPPITYAVPDNAANLRGYDLCSSGTTASIITFLTSALPASGWSKAVSNTRCFYTDQCWTKGSAVISWRVDDPINWNVAYRPATA